MIFINKIIDISHDLNQTTLPREFMIFPNESGQMKNMKSTNFL